MRTNCSDWYQVPLLSLRKVAISHYMPSLKGWVWKAASLMTMYKKERKKVWPSHTPSTGLIAMVTALRGCVSPLPNQSIPALTLSTTDLLNLDVFDWIRHGDTTRSAGSPGGMGHPPLITPSQKKTQSQTLTQEHLSRKAKTKPPSLWQNTLGVKNGESSAGGSCKGEKTEPKQCKD